MAGATNRGGWGTTALTLPSAVRVFVAAAPTDLRKSFDGLSIVVTSRFGQDLLRGDLFVFFNRRRTQVRVLFWDRTGHCIVAKKLARGTFLFVHREDGAEPCVEMEAAELSLILEGIDMGSAKRHLRWRPVRVVPTAITITIGRPHEPRRWISGHQGYCVYDGSSKTAYRSTPCRTKTAPCPDGWDCWHNPGVSAAEARTI
jgi:transposase